MFQKYLHLHTSQTSLPACDSKFVFLEKALRFCLQFFAKIFILMSVFNCEVYFCTVDSASNEIASNKNLDVRKYFRSPFVVIS